MSDVRAALRELAEPRLVDDRIKAAITRAARLADLSYWRCSDIWYGKAHRIEEAERARIAEALDKKRQQAARNEYHQLRLRLEEHEVLIRRALADLARLGAVQDQSMDHDQD